MVGLKYNNFTVSEDLKYTNIFVNASSQNQNHNTNTQTTNASFTSIVGEDANGFLKFILVLLDKLTGLNLLYTSIAIFFICISYAQTERLITLAEKYVLKDKVECSSKPSKE